MRPAVLTFLLALTTLALAGCEGRESAVETEPVAEAPSASTPVADPVRTASGTANQPGEVMPAYSANELGGGTWSLADEEGVTLLNLWATWCGPCRYEIPALIELQNDYGEHGLQVVGVSMDRSGMEPQISSFVKNAGINYKIVHDPRARLADVFETTIIPTTALIDRDGKILWIHAGIVSGDDPELLDALRVALDVKPSA